MSLSASLAALSGCASTMRGAEHAKNVKPATRDAREEAYRPGPPLAPAADGELDAALARARVVYVGEQHDDPHIHRFEQQLYQRLLAADPSVALGLEMLPVTLQAPLDAYLAGTLDEPAFLAAVDWEKTWGFPFAYYRPLLELARAHHVRAYALNAEHALVKKVAHQGTAGLSDEERRALPEMVPGPPAHRAQLEEAFAGHAAMHPKAPGTPGSDGAAASTTTAGAESAHSDAAERFYQAQLLWDETMAQSIARDLAGGGGARRMLVIVGEGHARRFAIPSRVERRGVAVGEQLVILPVYRRQLEPQKDAAADYLYVLAPHP